MRVLFIGGTGTISSAITRQLAQREDCELYLLNRGTYAQEVPAGIHELIGREITDAEIEEMADKCSGYGKNTVGCLKVLTRDDMVKIYEMAK